MSRRSLLQAGSSPAVIPDPEPETPWEPPPYDPGNVPAVPTSAPWHRPVPCEIPTYDGYDQTLHPTVLDFGGKWNGYRWWMMHTPYPVGIEGVWADGQENPSLVASNDCVTWTPVGPQPLVPQPEVGYNSDPELVWNPVARRIEFWWRPADGGGIRLDHMHSTDGTSWSERTTQIKPLGNFVSPSIVRYADDDWRMWLPDASESSSTPPSFRLYRSQATSSEGPWSTPIPTSAGGVDASLQVWHAGVARNPTSGTLYGLAHAYATNGIHAAISVDGGATWTWDPDPVLRDVPDTWTQGGMYRPCLVLHENGTHARVWYSGRSTALGWRIGYAELPLSVWPTPA